jgi:hypothetical protein
VHPDARLSDAGDIRLSPLLGSGTFGVMELHVGCAMWAYAPWQGRYLPHSLSPRDRLRAYATWCNAVEGNTTFYATPALPTVKSWAGQTTSDFRFVLKLPKPITHERRLADVDGHHPDDRPRMPVTGLPAVCAQTCGSLVRNGAEPVHTQWKCWGFRCQAATMTGPLPGKARVASCACRENRNYPHATPQ